MVASVQVLIPWIISGLWIAYKKFPMKVLCVTFCGLIQMTAEAGVFLLEEKYPASIDTLDHIRVSI